jgi:hypothetical protein
MSRKGNTGSVFFSAIPQLLSAAIPRTHTVVRAASIQRLLEILRRLASRLHPGP